MSLFLTVVLTTGVAVLGLSLARITSVAARKESVAPPLQQQAPSREDLEVIQVSLKPTGFDPQQLTVPRKRFALVVYNRSGLADVSLRFEGRFLDRPAIKGRYVPRQRHFGGLVDLPPGTYRITEATHPEWVCAVTVTNDGQ